MNTASEIGEILEGFDPISLDEVQKASLMRRKDSKYILNVLTLPSILSKVKSYYRVLAIEGKRSHAYCTHYYDTPDLEMYHLHHRGMANRHKVRFRKYITSDLHFLEVKTKNSKGITLKNRIRTSGMDASILTTEEEFLLTHIPYQPASMIPVLENQFNRITLVSLDQSERITLDHGLQFISFLVGRRLELPGVAIAEIKYENLLSGSPFNNVLREHHIAPLRFSKYAIGAALLDSGLKQNRFKVKVRKVHQINDQYVETVKSPSHA
jgi:hypothetical protein